MFWRRARVSGLLDQSIDLTEAMLIDRRASRLHEFIAQRIGLFLKLVRSRARLARHLQIIYGVVVARSEQTIFLHARGQ